MKKNRDSFVPVLLEQFYLQVFANHALILVRAFIKYIAAEDKAQKVLENQSVLKLPVVRNGKSATVGYQPEVWKTWK